jgi:glycosyltransferase involved in cell wall biosynthesis
MIETPILTIAIPTYNRWKNLEKILQQLKGQPNQNFILLISDDHSLDETEKMIKKYQEQMPNLVYHRNEVNLGYSGNVCKLYEIAKTRYIWYVCDDDTILPNAVDSVIAALKKYEPVVAVFNASWTNAYGQDLVAGVSEDKIYTNEKQLKTYQPLMRMTFLSINVFERRISLDKIKNADYKDNIYFQITLGLMLLENKFKFCEIASKVIHRNVGYKYGEFFKFYLVDQFKAIFIAKHNFDKQKFINWAIRHLPVALELYLSQKLGLFKYNGRPTWKTMRKIVEYYSVCGVGIALFPIIYLFTPTLLLKSIYYLKLISIHGKRKAELIYKASINRAFSDERKTGFTAYR